MPQAAIVPLLVASTAVGIFSSVKAGQQGKKAAGAAREQAESQEKARQAQQKIEELRLVRERRQAIRETRIAQARVAAGAEAGNVAGSSGAIGATSSALSQGASNVSFIDTTRGLSQQASAFYGQASQAAVRGIGYQQKAAQWQGIGQMAGSIGNLLESESFQSWVKGTTPKIQNPTSTTGGFEIGGGFEKMY